MLDILLAEKKIYKAMREEYSIEEIAKFCKCSVDTVKMYEDKHTVRKAAPAETVVEAAADGIKSIKDIKPAKRKEYVGIIKERYINKEPVRSIAKDLNFKDHMIVYYLLDDAGISTKELKARRSPKPYFKAVQRELPLKTQ